MTDTTLVAQFLAVAVFGACVFYAWNADGRRNTQQWFFISYIFFLLLISLLVVMQQIVYNPGFLVFGAAPSLLVMLYPAFMYLAFCLAKMLVAETDVRGMSVWMFLLMPALMLPLDVTGIQLQWWAFPSDSYAFLNGVPFYLPFAWGITAGTFMYMMGRIRKIRFRGSGQLFAMMIAAPLLDGILILLIALAQVVVDWLYALGGANALYMVLSVVFVGLPIALFLRQLPRRGAARR